MGGRGPTKSNVKELGQPNNYFITKFKPLFTQLRKAISNAKSSLGKEREKEKNNPKKIKKLKEKEDEKEKKNLFVRNATIAIVVCDDCLVSDDGQ